ncbi:hypothetical protein E8E12_011590 [Didymella heteroderae]|uniref:Uncharacterized protein n=1 Tax=Didymella heteroderae TaxID=1769908 RepID=A0A9P4X1E9_9PLEO|nr:hypothetical protein E8E12_011590 [Didymella heteroderae]
MPVESVGNRFKSALKQNQDLIALIKQLRTSATEQNKQRIDRLLSSDVDDASDNAAPFEIRNTSSPEQTLGESELSAEVGSNGETDALDEDIVLNGTTQSTGFIGKSSEMQWFWRLQRETKRLKQGSEGSEGPYGPPGTSAESSKQRIAAQKQRRRQEPDVAISTSTFYLDGDGVEVDYTVDPYAIPTIEVAQRLLERYMNTVQDTFPVLPKKAFSSQVRHFITSVAQGVPMRVPEKWLAILNLVFAIAARFSHLTGVDLHSDSQSHVVYQSRGHILSMYEPSLIHQPDLMRLQITALYAFYLTTVGNVNR